jgi:hypothetical protein
MQKMQEMKMKILEKGARIREKQRGSVSRAMSDLEAPPLTPTTPEALRKAGY